MVSKLESTLKHIYHNGISVDRVSPSEQTAHSVRKHINRLPFRVCTNVAQITYMPKQNNFCDQTSLNTQPNCCDHD